MKLARPQTTFLREKDGIALYEVTSGEAHYILKYFAGEAGRREITNYHLLQAAGIPTLPLLAETPEAILLPDVKYHPDWRLGGPEDLADPVVGAAIARWYRQLHQMVPTAEVDCYDETELITLPALARVAQVTKTTAAPLWRSIESSFQQIQQKIQTLPKVVTYNDFYWTNLVVAKDGSAALMLDYHLLGKGYLYGDLRNVTSSLAPIAATTFLEAYGMTPMVAEQKDADDVLAHLITLIIASQREVWPTWAEPSLKLLKNGDLQQALQRWLSFDQNPDITLN